MKQTRHMRQNLRQDREKLAGYLGKFMFRISNLQCSMARLLDLISESYSVRALESVVLRFNLSKRWKSFQ